MRGCTAGRDGIRTDRLCCNGAGPQGHPLLEPDAVHRHQLQLSPAGKDAWGPDQCKNDRDGTVDHDERLRITGIEPGRYDAKLADRIGRVCIVRDIDVKDGAVFAIEEKQLTDCRNDAPLSGPRLPRKA